MTLHFQPSKWHPGEAEIQQLLRVPPQPNPTAVGLPARYAHRVAQSPLVAFGALDAEGRPWATVWGGEPGFARPVGHGVLSADSLADARHDPVLHALLLGGGSLTGEYQITREELEGGRGRLVAGLSIDLAMRDRVKLAGRLVAGSVAGAAPDASPDFSVARVQVAMLVEESLGNCPKYLNKKAIRHCVPRPRLVAEGLPLPREALALLGKADLFFLSTTNGEGMDVNHRGGPPGFVRVMSNSHEEGGGVHLCYPEYSGNRLYQTLGNMQIRPLVGMVVPDFATGDVLYLTGETTILAGADARRVLTHTPLAVRVRVTAARFVAQGLPFRGDHVDHSPYNPPVRRLAAEISSSGPLSSDAASTAEPPPAVATLVDREMITPVLARFTFSLQAARPAGLKTWRPGQHVTLDFSAELDGGWSHMRDDDPGSLNDDFVRTFTISNPPPPPPGADDDDTVISDGTRLEITARRHGPATRLLWTHHLRVPLQVPVLGFGGEDSFRVVSTGSDDDRPIVFVAGGVGITPLLAQAPALLQHAPGGGGRFEVLWSLRDEDLPLARDTFRRIPGLAAQTRVFVTGARGARGAMSGGGDDDDDDDDELGRLLVDSISSNSHGDDNNDDNKEGGRTTRVKIKRGRITRGDLLVQEEEQDEAAAPTRRRRGKTKYYLCAGRAMVTTLLGWLEGEDVVYETFEY